MAVSLPNHSFLSPCAPSASFSSKPSAPSLGAPAPLLRRGHRGLGFSAPGLRPAKLRYSATVRRLRFPLAATEDSAVSSVDKQEDLESPEKAHDLGDSLSVSELCEVYKRAIFSGDEKRISDVGAKICDIVMKKLELGDRFSSLSAEMNSGKEKYLLQQADFDNFRKRSNKEALIVRSEAQREAIENLLPMVDNFETARKQIKPVTEKEKKIDTSYQGIYKQFVEVLRSLNVSAIATVGKPFDPLLHEATAREESEDYKAGTIIRELQRGFLLKDRVLRAAKVKVSLGPGGKKVNASSDEPSRQTATTAGIDER